MADQPFYHLRPNKYIDRNLFVQILTYLNRLLPIEEYSYIGFGSFFFDDFKLIHNQLNISKMVSLENDPTVCERADFNKPFSCIQIENTTSSDYISNLSLDGERSIIWLDYTDPKELGSQFADFCSILDILNPNDIIRITLNANPSCLGDDPKDVQLHQKRFNKLLDRIAEYMPIDTTEKNTTFHEYPRLLLRCLKKAAIKTLVEAPPYQKKFLFPLSSSIYKDGQQMVTLTAIVLDNHDEKENIKLCLAKCQQATFEWDKPCIIRVPPLTQKEILHINNLLPSSGARQQILDNFAFSFDCEEDESPLDSYLNYYKYYPNFHHVSL